MRRRVKADTIASVMPRRMVPLRSRRLGRALRVALSIAALVGVGGCSSEPGAPNATGPPFRGTLAVVEVGAGKLATIAVPGGHPGPVADSGLSPVAVAVAGGTAWVAASLSGALIPVDLRTGAAGTPIQVGGRPTALALFDSGHAALVVDSVDADVTAVDLAHHRVGRTVPLPGVPVAVAVAGGTAYIADRAGDRLYPLALGDGHLGPPIAVGGAPSSIAVSPDGRRAWVTDSASSTVSVVDLAAGRTTSTVAVGADPLGVAVSPDGTLVAVTEAAIASVAVIDASDDRAVANVAVGEDPYGVAIDPDDVAWISDAGSGDVMAVDLRSRRVRAPIELGDVSPEAVALSR